jgi:protease-4
MKKKTFFFSFFLSLIALTFLGFVIAGIFLILKEQKADLVISTTKKVGLIKVDGIILDSKDVINQIHQFRDNHAVYAVLLRIDSPGGGVGASQEIYREILKLREKKKVIVSMGSLAASGGYYIASAADWIIANPGTLTGSIGVILQGLNTEELMKKLGLKIVVVKSGKYKDILSPDREMTEDERKLLQGLIDDTYEQFLDAIVQGRKNLNKETLRSVADGRVFTGNQAKEYGLVDELGNLQDALERAAQLVGIEGKPEVVEPKKSRLSFLERLLESLTQLSPHTLEQRTPRLLYLFQ